MESMISSHNKKVLKNENTDTSHSKIECNCRDANLCPLKGKCLRSSIVYQADVITNSSTSTFIGFASNSFKEHYNNHLTTFKNKNKAESTSFFMSIRKDSYTYFKSLKPLKQKNGDNEHLQT